MVRLAPVAAPATARSARLVAGAVLILAAMTALGVAPVPLWLGWTLGCVGALLGLSAFWRGRS